MVIRIAQLDHVVLRVADMDRMLRFYIDVLGCHEERRLASIGLVQLRAGASLIDLMEKSDSEQGPGHNMDHFAVRIDPFDEASLRAHLVAHGVAAGSVESRYGAEGTGPSLYIEDPEGNTVELKGPPVGSG